MGIFTGLLGPTLSRVDSNHHRRFQSSIRTIRLSPSESLRDSPSWTLELTTQVCDFPSSIHRERKTAQKRSEGLSIFGLYLGCREIPDRRALECPENHA